MRKSSSTVLCLCLAGSSCLLAAEKPDLTKLDLGKLPPPAEKKGVTFEKDIRPIFEVSCFRCHGEERQRGELRLDSLEAVLKGGEDGKVIVPGKSKESWLVAAVAQVDDEIAMPPKRRPGGPGGPGGAGFRGGAGGRGGFGPGMMLAPQMLSQGDKNRDRRLSHDEFTSLAETWFDKLDSEKTGKLTQQQFVEKLGEVLPPPQGAPGGGQRRGGPGRFIGPGLFAAADTDKDGSLTRAELKGTFAKWATDFDSDKTGSLNEEKLQAGLNAILLPNFGGRGGPRGPGAADGGGGPGPGGRGPGGTRGPGGGFAPPKPLTPEQISLVRAWIDQGAK